MMEIIRFAGFRTGVEAKYIRNQSIESRDTDDQLDMDADRLKMDEVAEDGWKVVEKRKKKQRG